MKIKKPKVPPSAAPAKPAGARRRGRPAVHENGLLDAKLIIACAFELSKTTPLQELSMVRVARELGVTPALIHYYLDGRDALTSGVMNSFYREMLKSWPAPSEDWRKDFEVASHHIYDALVRFSGIAAYMVAHNRFRMAQLVRDGETDHGVLLFERFIGVIRSAGFDAHRTGVYATLLMEFIVSGAFATVRHRWPSDQVDFIDKVFAGLDPGKFPNTYFVHKSHFQQISGEASFSLGFNLVLNGLELERAKLQNASSTKSSPRKKS